MSPAAAKKRVLGPAEKKAICTRWIEGESDGELAAAFKVGERTIARIRSNAGLKKEHRRAPGSATNDRRPRPDFRGDYTKLGAPPTEMAPADRPSDPLATADYLVKALETSARHVMLDTEYEGTELERRKELRDIARSIATITPQALLHRAKKLIEADAGERDRTTGGPEEEELATSVATRAHRAAPRRGRPRIQ